MKKILVATCLMGKPVRYNGSDALCNDPILLKWQKEGRLVHFCPEIAAGLPIPRPPAEITGGDGGAVLEGQAKVIDNAGNNITRDFVEGAKKTYDFAKKNNVKIAILKDGSPTCGSTFIYDGSFTGCTRPGRGVTAQLLEQEDIRVFSEKNLCDALNYLESLE